MAGQIGGQTLFHRTILATTGGPASTTATDWHLKVKDIEYNADVIKNYCITFSMQKSAQFTHSFLTYASRFTVS